MFSATSLLVLASACAVTVNAQEYSNCTTVHTGNNESNHAVKLPTVYIQKDLLADEVVIPPVLDCHQSESGVQAVVCDMDLPPEALFINFTLLLVNRIGPASDNATVDVTVFCTT